jgi:DNA-binding NtrC family response regulator
MNKLIYFVDDDKMILNLLEYTFKSRDNYDVKTFRTGEDCLVAMIDKPSLIVLDHNFVIENTKFASGLEILKKIREIDNNVDVIMLSGEDNKLIIDNYIKCGVTKFIVKDSFFIDSLIESIKNVLNQSV